MQRIHTLIMIKWMISVFVVAPHYIKPNLPFANEKAAHDYELHLLQECTYQYWTYYNGINGYKKVFGDDHLFNKSTVFKLDGHEIKSYKHWRDKAIVPQNVISFSVLEWSPYQVFFRYTTSIRLPIGPLEWRDTQGVIQSFNRITYFEDNSGIVKHLWTNSTPSVFRLDISDDSANNDTKYTQTPIQCIFIFVFCVSSIIVGVCSHLRSFIASVKTKTKTM
eukprot:688302_1